MPSNILDHFSSLEDPRQKWKVIYPLQEILLVVLCGVMAGADDFVDIAKWGEEKLTYLRRSLPFKNGIPSHDTLNDVMNALPTESFAECFTKWVETLREDAPDIVAIDGKTSRRAHGVDGRPLHLVSAWASQARLVLGQEPCDVKENEISTIPRLLDRLELRGALVTIDAMGCQHGIAEKIHARGADYLLALKGNQKSLHDEVRLFFENTQSLERFETTDNDHGRVEIRRAYISKEVNWLTGSKREPNAPHFPHLARVGMVESEVEVKGKTTIARRYFLTSAHFSAKEFLRATRAHWGVENCLHWVMDVVFHDDLMRLRTDNGPANMAIMRHTALNMFKGSKAKMSLKTKRKTASWNHETLFKTLLNQM